MNGRYDRPLTPAQIASEKDESIDFSDIPELDEEFWERAELVEPDRTDQITMRVKRSVLAYFKAPGKGYQTRMNRVLESYVRAQDGGIRRHRGGRRPLTGGASRADTDRPTRPRQREIEPHLVVGHPRHQRTTRARPQFHESVLGHRLQSSREVRLAAPGQHRELRERPRSLTGD